VTDVLTVEQRRRAMQSNKSRRTMLELRMADVLTRLGIPFEANARVEVRKKGRGMGSVEVDFLIPPDIVLEVRGCFWHGCWEHYRMPRSNKLYWGPKIEANVRRDKLTIERLRRAGYFVRSLWEHDVSALAGRYELVMRQIMERRKEWHRRRRAIIR
jgi:DNA mismatch endonuclease (patch repair protein)